MDYSYGLLALGFIVAVALLFWLDSFGQKITQREVNKLVQWQAILDFINSLDAIDDLSPHR